MKCHDFALQSFCTVNPASAFTGVQAAGSGREVRFCLKLRTERTEAEGARHCTPEAGRWGQAESGLSCSKAGALITGYLVGLTVHLYWLEEKTV